VRKFEHPQELADARNGEKSPETVAGTADSLPNPHRAVNSQASDATPRDHLVDCKGKWAGATWKPARLPLQSTTMKLLPEKVGGENISIFSDSTFACPAVAAPVAGEARAA
jgi:hypothetical protein